MIFFVGQKNCVLGYSWSTLLWYRCYYPHRSRDALSPLCGIFVVVDGTPNQLLHIAGLNIFVKRLCTKTQLLLGPALRHWYLCVSVYVFVPHRPSHLVRILSEHSVGWNISRILVMTYYVKTQFQTRCSRGCSTITSEINLLIESAIL